MSARERILDNIRRATPQDQNGAGMPHPPAVLATALPADAAGRIELFIRRAEESGAQVVSLHGPRSGTIFSTGALNEFLPLCIPDTVLKAELQALDSSAFDIDSPTTLIRADAALAETGTICLGDNGAGSKYYFLCERLLILLRTEDILGCQEEYWARLAGTSRAIHLITGPSRTADVEQTLQIGAHGPKSVTIFLIYRQTGIAQTGLAGMPERDLQG